MGRLDWHHGMSAEIRTVAITLSGPAGQPRRHDDLRRYGRRVDRNSHAPAPPAGRVSHSAERWHFRKFETSPGHPQILFHYIGIKTSSVQYFWKIIIFRGSSTRQKFYFFGKNAIFMFYLWTLLKWKLQNSWLNNWADWCQYLRFIYFTLLTLALARPRFLQIGPTAGIPPGTHFPWTILEQKPNLTELAAKTYQCNTSVMLLWESDKCFVAKHLCFF